MNDTDSNNENIDGQVVEEQPINWMQRLLQAPKAKSQPTSQPAQEPQKKGKGRPKKQDKMDLPKIIDVEFDEVANEILMKYHIITFDDTKEVYVYEDGLYTKKGAITTLENAIRLKYSDMFYKRNEKLINIIDQIRFANDEEEFHIPVPKTTYVNEAMNYIRAKTVIFRDIVDQAYPRLINLKNGMFDVNTWKLIPHDPKYLSTRQIPITYDPEARCPGIARFLSQVVSPEDAKVLIEFAGYALIRDMSMQKAIMLYGEGSNGKSIFLRLVTKAIGDDNVSGVSLQALQNDKFKAANLYGKLLNIYPDLNDQTIYQSDIFKTLVGGDRVDAEFKYMPPFHFYNTARLMFSANKIPAVKNKEYAFFRRWILIPFPHVFKEGQDDKHLFEKLTIDEELSGFLNLMLDGLKTVLENDKFSYTQTIEDVEKAYKLHSGSVATFAENCLKVSERETRKSYMYKVYIEWCKSKNIKPVAINVFGQQMKKLGFEDSRVYYETYKCKVWTWDNVEVDDEKFEKDTIDPKTGIGKSTWGIPSD